MPLSPEARDAIRHEFNITAIVTITGLCCLTAMVVVITVFLK
jgi:hypothetical protein